MGKFIGNLEGSGDRGPLLLKLSSPLSLGLVVSCCSLRLVLQPEHLSSCRHFPLLRLPCLRWHFAWGCRQGLLFVGEAGRGAVLLLRPACSSVGCLVAVPRRLASPPVGLTSSTLTLIVVRAVQPPCDSLCFTVSNESERAAQSGRQLLGGACT